MYSIGEGHAEVVEGWMDGAEMRSTKNGATVNDGGKQIYYLSSLNK